LTDLDIDIITLFPEIFEGPLSASLIGRARESGLLNVRIHNLRDFVRDKHKKVDDYPYGGGCGMVIKPEPIFSAVESLAPGLVVYLTPQGRLLTQGLAEEISKKGHIIFICGRYEGIDERVIEALVDLELSVGDYVATGGEIPCLLTIDVIARLIPGVLGNVESAKDESFSKGLLEGPQYTRPKEFRGMRVPEILLSGDHKKIAEWRMKKAIEKTKRIRPDLLGK
jgi:tRNA (guanine37-N1)-methyltransferase